MWRCLTVPAQQLAQLGVAEISIRETEVHNRKLQPERSPRRRTLLPSALSPRLLRIIGAPARQRNPGCCGRAPARQLLLQEALQVAEPDALPKALLVKALLDLLSHVAHD
eukprot:125010-Chlamydomonas_euryale.AAC.2